MTPDPEQYAALRHGVGARRLARDVVEVAGPGAAAYLDGQCSQDLGALGSGDATWSLILEPDGKLCALVAVARVDDDRFVLSTQGGFGERVVARLTRFKLRTRADIVQLDFDAVGVRGVAVPPPSGSDAVVVPFSLGGWSGYDVLGSDPAASVPEDAVWCDNAAWDACRVESAVPVMGRELDERTIAQEADLVPWTVSLTKGCYTGQELVARLDARGNRVARRLCSVVLDSSDGAAPDTLEGAELRSGDRDAGTVTSAAWCPMVDGLAGLAMVRRAVAVGDQVDVVGRDGGTHRARVAPAPLFAA